MDIRATIRNWMKRGAEAEGQKSADPNIRPSEMGDMTRLFRGETERRRIVEACRRMYRTDPRVKREHRSLARDIVRGGFVLQTADEAALNAATTMIRRTGLDDRLDDYVRLAARDGDLFLQLIVNERMEITEISRKPTLQTHRASNNADEFDQPERAFWMGANEFAQEPPRDAAWFADWEMIHARWEHDEGERYGSPMFAAATGAFRRVEEGETDIAVRRKIGSGRIVAHVVEGASEGDLALYKKENKPALDSPFAAVSHYFFNKKGTLEVTPGDASLPEIGDVEHHIATMFTAGETPMELIAYGGNLNRDVLAEKKAEYDETLEELRRWVNEQIIRPLLERQWLLAGILPASVKYSIQWRSQQLLKPEDIKAIADAGMRLRILGLPEEVTMALVARFLPGVDLADLKGAGKDTAQSAAQMAAIMQSMRGGLA